MSPVVFGEKPTRRSRTSHLEERLARFLVRAQLPAPVRELRFAPPRLWRFDFAWPDRQIAVEIEGGVFVRGGHSRGVDFTDDCEKYDIAALLGWRVYRFTVKQFESGWVFTFVRAVLSVSREEQRALLEQTVGTATPQLLLGSQAQP
jgi:uncharacterized protein YecE (DUF72 family)